MNAQERDLLTQFLRQLSQAPAVARDPEADALITQAVARPDAAYLLVQHAIMLEQANRSAQERIAALEQQLRQGEGAATGGFLQGGNAWGHAPSAAVAAPPATAIPGTAGPRPVAPAVAMAAPVAAPAGPGFLGTFAAGAAGAIGGALLFQGVEGLLHHGASPAAGALGLGLPQAAAGSTVINNYYGGDEDTADTRDDAYDALAADDLPDDAGDTQDWA